MSLLNDIELHYVGGPVSAANNTDDDSAIIDISTFDGVVFLTAITDSVDTGVATLTVEQDGVNAAGGMTALTGAVATATSAANDDLNTKFLVVDVKKPTERYLRANRTSATANIAFGDCIAVKYRNIKKPVTQLAAEVAGSATVVSPAEAA